MKKISNIKINNRLRNAKQNKVESLAESIKGIGLLQPISIDNENNLISGLHRLEACKLLNQTEIECNVLTFENSTLKQLAEIDENLIRNDLTVLEKGDWLHVPIVLISQANGKYQERETKPITEYMSDDSIPI